MKTSQNQETLETINLVDKLAVGYNEMDVQNSRNCTNKIKTLKRKGKTHENTQP